MALSNAERQARHRARYRKVAFTASEVACLESVLQAAMERCVAPSPDPVIANVLWAKLTVLTVSQGKES